MLILLDVDFSILDLEQGWARQAILLQQKYILTFYLKKGNTLTRFLTQLGLRPTTSYTDYLLLF